MLKNTHIKIQSPAEQRFYHSLLGCEKLNKFHPMKFGCISVHISFKNLIVISSFSVPNQVPQCFLANVTILLFSFIQFLKFLLILLVDAFGIFGIWQPLFLQIQSPCHIFELRVRVLLFGSLKFPTGSNEWKVLSTYKLDMSLIKSVVSLVKLILFYFG